MTFSILPGSGQKHYESRSGETCQVHLLPHEEGGNTGHCACFMNLIGSARFCQKPQPVWTMTAMRAVAPAADEEVDTRGPPLQEV